MKIPISREALDIASRFVRAVERIAGAVEAIAVQDRARFAVEHTTPSLNSAGSGQAPWSQCTCAFVGRPCVVHRSPVPQREVTPGSPLNHIVALVNQCVDDATSGRGTSILLCNNESQAHVLKHATETRYGDRVRVSLEERTLTFEKGAE